MPKVDTFIVQNDLYPDTRIPFQFRGNSQTPEERAFELAALVGFMQSNLVFQFTVTPGLIDAVTTSIAIPAKRLVIGMVVIGSAAGTCNVGITPGGTEVVEGNEYTTTGEVWIAPRYFHTAGNLHFSAYGVGHTLTVRLMLANLT